MNASTNSANRELPVRTANGWVMLIVAIALLAAGLYFIFHPIVIAERGQPFVLKELIAGLVCQVAFVFMLPGFFTLQPNAAAVLILFGAYQGTQRRSGFHWTNPLNRKQKISLR